MINLKYNLLNIKFLLLGFIVLLTIILFPNNIFAAHIYAESATSTVMIGDTVIVNVMLDSVGENPNVIDGEIVLKNALKNIDIIEFSRAGSVLTYWPNTPSLETNSKIYFTGGTPGGFNQESALLFKIVFKAEGEGRVSFVPDNIKVYNNDGKATRLSINTSPFEINILPNKGGEFTDEWTEIISNDNKPPKNISAIIGQDSDVFDGKKFISISASDDESGIAYFEVREGNKPVARSGDTYILQNQDELSTITIIAYDKAGNSSKIVIGNNKNDNGQESNIIFILLVIVLIYSLIRFIIIIRKKNVTI
jgi:hypothetical protein